MQLKKLGVMPPEQLLPLKCYRIHQVMWANNGDTISRQYAGTAALKVKTTSLSQCSNKGQRLSSQEKETYNGQQLRDHSNSVSC